jgi:hypothetical protein
MALHFVKFTRKRAREEQSSHGTVTGRSRVSLVLAAAAFSLALAPGMMPHERKGRAMILVLGIVLLVGSVALTWAARPAPGQDLSRVMRVPLGDPLIQIVILVMGVVGAAAIAVSFGII